MYIKFNDEDYDSEIFLAINDNENTIEYKNEIATFKVIENSYKNRCENCIGPINIRYCMKLPCIAEQRLDQKDVYFKLIDFVKKL